LLLSFRTVLQKFNDPSPMDSEAIAYVQKLWAKYFLSRVSKS